MTGDLYGATAEITEALLFLFIAALAGRGWIGPCLLG
jgi:cobalamin synthase